jgi:hypothetical protein
MRSSPRRSLRAIIVLLLLHVTFVGAAAPHAAARPADAAAHVEAAGTADCPVSHDDTHCLICQAMSLRILAADAVRLQALEAVGGSGSLPAAAPGCASAIASPGQARGPPSLVA